MNTQGLTDDELKAAILIDVKTVLSNLSGTPAGNMSATTNLTTDLNLTDIEIEALYLPFSKIAKKYNAAAGSVSTDECSNCEIIDDCVGLIFSKI